MDIVERLKDLYFSVEDKYYAFLDTVQKRIPVYSIVDPIDKILPSFGIILAVLVALLGFGLFAGLSGVLSGGEKFDLDVTFKDAAGGNVSGVHVVLEKDSVVIDSKTTQSNGGVVFSIPSGRYDLFAEKDGYEPFSQSIEILQKKSQSFTLKQLIPPAKQRALLIKDASGNVLGVLSSVDISLSFSCQSGTPPGDQTSSSGNISFLQPGNCTSLSVSINATGYISKTIAITSDSTQVVLQSSASLGPEEPISSSTGIVEVLVKGPNASPVEQAQIKLYKVPAAGSNVLANQTLSDPNGLGIFQNVTPGKHVVIVTKSGFKQTTSAEFQVNAGETVSQTLTLPVSSNKRKLFVKVVSSLNQLPVSGASVTLFAQSSLGKMVEYDSYTTDSNGMVKDLLADFNGSTSLVVAHDNYVIDIAPNTGIVPEEQAAPIPIILTPLAAPSANGTISNALIINVKATDEVGLAINNATTRLFSPDLNGVVVKVLKTNTLGVAKFSNLPAGDYQATVSTSTADGNSSKVNGNVNQTLNLPVTLTLGNALVKVIVKDELNTLIADANVSIYSVSGNNLLTKGTTNAQGLVQLGVSTGQQVYVRVDKSPYLPFISIPFDVLKNNTHTINIEVSLTNPSQAADISLSRIDQISTSGAVTLANSLANGGLYAFHFTVKSSLAQNNMKAVVRLNGDNATSHNSSLDVGSIVGGQSAKGGVSFYLVNNPSNPFSPSSSVNSNTPSKVLVNSLGDVNTSSYELVVLVKIRPTPSPVPPVADKLEIRFQAQSDVSTNTTSYFETYTIGQPLNQSNFSFVFLISGGTFTSPIQINGGYPIVIEKGVDYTVDYRISNTSGTSPTNALLDLRKDVDSLTLVPANISLSNFANNSVASGSFTLRSSVACGGPPTNNTSYCATLTPTITGTTTTPAPAFPIRVFTTPSKALFVTPTPSFLIPAQANQPIQVVVRDQLGVLRDASTGVQVKGIVKDVGGTVLVPEFTFTPTGSFFAGSIPSSPDGSFLEIRAIASQYTDGVVNVPISSQILLNYSTDFSCLQFTPTPNPFTFLKDGSATLNVRAQNCLGDVVFYTKGFSPAPNTTYALTVKNGGNVVSSTAPVTLSNGQNVNLTVSLPSGPFGQYPLYVYAKYASQSKNVQPSLVKNIDTFVQPLGGLSGNCLNLSKYIFDISDGADAADIVNNCNPLVHDPFYPSVSLPISGVYGFASPSVLTPEMQNPTSPLTFKFNVSVDYNNARHADMNIDDFPRNPPIVDGNWYRYEIPAANGLFGQRDDYMNAQGNPLPGVKFNKIPDSQKWSDNLYLEIQNNPLSPWVTSPSIHSVLLESTFITYDAVTLDQLCFNYDALRDFKVIIDGQVIHNFTTPKISHSACLTNYRFSAGPHTIQIYFYKDSAQDYWVSVKYKDLPFTLNANPGIYGYDELKRHYAPLSKGYGHRFFLSPEYGSLYSRQNKTNGLYKLDTVDVSAKIVPYSAAQHSSTSLKTLTDTPEGTAISAILSNMHGADYLKRVFLRSSTDNPSVRTFVHDKEVFAAYTGFDTPDTTQQVIINNISSAGERYAVLNVSDYSTNTAGTNVTADVGVLLDASSSLFLNDHDENALFSNDNVVQSGLCNFLNNVEREIEYYSGADVRLRIAVMGDTRSFYSRIKSNRDPTPRLEFPDPFTCLSGLKRLDASVFPSNAYVAGKHDVNEAWAFAAEKFANNKYTSIDDTGPFWTSPQKLMIILTDNKPSGLGKNVLNSDWDTTPTQFPQMGAMPLEDALVARAASALNAKSIKGVVLYRTPIESTALSASNQSLAIASYDSFASSTNGFVEAWENPELIYQKGVFWLTGNPDVWSHAQNNKVGVRLAQTLFTRDTESMLVKLVSLPANACVSESGDIGQTGASAFPSLKYDWRWTEFQKNPHVCDFNSTSFVSGKYCDASQFMMTLVEKLEALEQAYAPAATPAQKALIPSLQTFDSYLMYDSFSTDFREDFVDYYTNIDFAQTPPYFKPVTGNVEGVWKDYLLDAQKLSFVINGNTTAPTIPVPGLYRVHIDVDWPSTPGEFFTASSPNATITVSLNLLADARNLSNYSAFFELPLNGRVGYDASTQTYHRNGYGTTFTGDVYELVSYTGMSVKTYANQPGNVSLNTYNVPALPNVSLLNTQNRGELFSLDQANAILHIRPSLPAPLAMEWASDTAGNGDAYYGIGETTPTNGNPAYVSSSNGLLSWVPFGSIEKQPTLGCAGQSCSICLDGGANPYISNVAYDTTHSTSACGLRSPLTNTTAFGFTSNGVSDNAAYLASIFYRIPANTYTIIQGCNAPSPTHGRILTMNGMVNDNNPSTQIDAGSIEDILASRTTLADWLSLTTGDYTCLSTQNNETKLYWNAKELRNDFTLNAFTLQGFGALTGLACTAAGSPTGVAGIYTLNERTDSVFTGKPPSAFLGFCPLFNDNDPVNGYYEQYGIPYPVGTKIFHANGGPITNDPDDGLVQYRYNPSSCKNLTTMDCPISPGKVAKDRCRFNTERYWSGIPLMQP
ncbi:MAG: carboxypeptidase regulatory-like domain-containing protein [Candidatus Diapherotrites archaeon]|uniref:Carboxypeptidase regulatory-like domain-containing protein n=1 Tax=Candidatus Iainarchaeum sp. TaxID=3101447 RepID=A0A8T4C7V1_9ARCH|nr:carboxypeptidase regulatory-like domain-containing protein [Candidatus Diapherotrites archaeon]